MAHATGTRSRPKYVLPGTVRDAAIKRIRWVWDEFDGNVVVGCSGGKDSTVTVELALEVARERDALPLTVFWLDQECELDATVRYVRDLFSRPEIDGRWYQIPFRLFNATNHADSWLHVWDDTLDPDEWVRRKEPADVPYTVITDNTYGTDRFVDTLRAIGDDLAPGGAVLTGVRVEESMTRRMGMTSSPSYKWVTWGSKAADDHLTFCPIYDWSYRDVWKAIHDGGWDYNRDYDVQHRYGVPAKEMRVSNYHHETSLHVLFRLQETEPETYEAATRRLDGIATVARAGEADFWVRDLPFMFQTWHAYHDYLVEHLAAPEHRAAFRKQRDRLIRRLEHIDPDDIARRLVPAVLANDHTGTKAGGVEAALFLRNRNLRREICAERGGPPHPPGSPYCRDCKTPEGAADDT